MLTAICAALLAGALLGLRFKLFILLPGTTLALLSVAVVGVVQNETVMTILVTSVFVGVALQLS